MNYIKPDIVLTEDFGAAVNTPTKEINYQTRGLIEGTGGYVGNVLTRKDVAEMARLFRNAQKSFRFEARVLEKYQTETGLPVVNIDDETITKGIRNNATYEGSVTRLTNAILETKTRDRFQEEVDKVYGLIKKSTSERSPISREELGDTQECGFGPRDIAMAAKLKSFVEKNPGKRIAFVAGGLHFSFDPDAPSVYAQTTDLCPNVFVLSDADSLNGSEAI